MELTDIIDTIGRDRFDSACQAAWEIAEHASYGSAAAPQFDSAAADEAADMIDASNLPPVAAIDLMFRLYDRIPCYAVMMHACWILHRLPKKSRTSFWTALLQRLGSEHLAIRQPAAYSLWCDVFEDPDLVHEAWATLGHAGVPPTALREVLRSSGPVPYRLKAKLYRDLLPNQAWHNAIFKSLFHSLNDVYGDIDLRKAHRVLGQLKLPAETPGLEELRASLSA